MLQSSPMRLCLLTAAFLVALTRCASTSALPPAAMPSTPVAAPPAAAHAVAYSSKALAVISTNSSGRCELELIGAEGARHELPGTFICSAGRIFSTGEEIVASDDHASYRLRNGEFVAAEAVIALAAESRIVRAGNTFEWVRNEQVLRSLAPSLRRPQILHDGSAVVAVEIGPDGERLARLSAEGALLPLTPFFSGIDSFGLDPKGAEVAVSVKRETSFDVALAALDGSMKLNWVGPEPTDETMVTWAPRGNKITYVVTQYGGTTLRTVHVPTGYQVAADFPELFVSAIAWEPQAERYAAIVSSPLLSPHVQTIRYGGEDRRIVTQPTDRRRGAVEPLSMNGIEAVMVTPPIRYGHKYPLIVAKTASPLAWNDVAAEALAESKAGVLLVPASAPLTTAFWQLALMPAWIDTSRVFVIEPSRGDFVPKQVRTIPTSRNRAEMIENVRAALRATRS